MMHRVIIALGSNIGDRTFYMQAAVHYINAIVGEVADSSPIVETEAWGFKSEPFLNQIVVVYTEQLPMQLLDTLQDIEKALGRTEKSGVDESGNPIYHPRTIDLDILDYDGVKFQNERLTLPHPQVFNRDYIIRLLKQMNIQISK